MVAYVVSPAKKMEEYEPIGKKARPRLRSSLKAAGALASMRCSKAAIEGASSSSSRHRGGKAYIYSRYRMPFSIVSSPPITVFIIEGL